MGVGDAKRELAREFRGELPAGIKAAEPFCGGCLVVEGASYEEDQDLAERIARSERSTIGKSSFSTTM